MSNYKSVLLIVGKQEILCVTPLQHPQLVVDGDHLLQCTQFNEYPTDNVVSRYWEARRQMAKKPSTGVG
ncbi:hypothetical protein TNCV_1432111 [Trichonephila clavipes]|nr:hypothetical protein TNCV_1432111 [Trichonephila clavipes]